MSVSLASNHVYVDMGASGLFPKTIQVRILLLCLQYIQEYTFFWIFADIAIWAEGNKYRLPPLSVSCCTNTTSMVYILIFVMNMCLASNKGWRKRKQLF